MELSSLELSSLGVSSLGVSSSETSSTSEPSKLYSNTILLLSKLISDTLKVPVIGIGSGKFCDGQVQVLYDVIGISSNPPKFSKNYLTGSLSIKDAIKEFYNYVKNIKN